MPKLERSFYTKLLKNKHVKRADINRKRYAKQKRSIIRDLTQLYSSEGLTPQETKKLIRQHGMTIPADINKDIFGFAGVRQFRTPDVERKEIEYVKKLKGNVLPSEERIFRTTRVAKGSYTYIVKVKGYPTTAKARKPNKLHTRSILIAYDRPVTKARVKSDFELALEGEKIRELGVQFIDSPPLGDLMTELKITSFSVVGLMKGV